MDLPGLPSRDRAETPARARPFDPPTWGGALIVMAAVAALLWVVQILNAADDYQLDRFGVRPREVDGLWGVVTMPFLHSSYAHLLSNTIPLVLIGWVLMLAGLSTWATVTSIVMVGGGALTWLAGPGGTVIVGASALIFGWLGYLLARAYFSRRLKWIAVAVLVLVFFGTLLFGLFPTLNSDVSWQAHVCGFAAGIGAGALLHPRPAQRRTLRGPVVS